jgi:hypothetical protein
MVVGTLKCNVLVRGVVASQTGGYWISGKVQGDRTLGIEGEGDEVRFLHRGKNIPQPSKVVEFDVTIVCKTWHRDGRWGHSFEGISE